MQSSPTPEELKTFPLLRPLAADVLATLSAQARVLALSPAEPLFRAGEAAESFYGVLEGSVLLYRCSADGREHVVQEVGPGRTLAEAAVFGFGVFPVFARGGTRGSRLLRLPGAAFIGHLDRDPKAMHSVLAALCRHLHDLVDRVELLSLPDAGQRLARYIMRLPAERRAQSYVVRLPIAKKDLAVQLAMTPETLSRCLKRWRDEAWAIVEDQQIELLQVSAIEDLSAES